MKKLICILLMLGVLSAAMLACGKQNNTDPVDKPSIEQPSDNDDKGDNSGGNNQGGENENNGQPSNPWLGGLENGGVFEAN